MKSDQEPVTSPPTPAKRRRWRTYSLRTFFVVVTVICCWLAIEVDNTRIRKKVAKKYQTEYQLHFYGRRSLSTPWYKKAFGGATTQVIVFERNMPNDVISELKGVFPDAVFVSQTQANKTFLDPVWRQKHNDELGDKPIF